MPARNPFGEDADLSAERTDPFGEELEPDSLEATARRLDAAAVKIRGLRSQLGAEGMPPAAARTLLEEVTASLHAVARAMRRLEERP